MLKEYKVKNIIGLCSDKEIKWHENINKCFSCERIVLPDSNTKKLPDSNNLEIAFSSLIKAVNKNITFIHCFASIERSPLLCVMFIMEKYKLNLEDALDYVKRVHSFTNPTNKQLTLIKKYMADKSLK